MKKTLLLLIFLASPGWGEEQEICFGDGKEYGPCAEHVKEGEWEWITPPELEERINKLEKRSELLEKMINKQNEITDILHELYSRLDKRIEELEKCGCYEIYEDEDGLGDGIREFKRNGASPSDTDTKDLSINELREDSKGAEW